MFPWSQEFVWDAGHLAFFGAFYSVLLAIGTVLALGLRRARAAARAGRAHRVAWRAAFEDLPARDRACRHQLTGEAPGRVCDNAFDCRHCAPHTGFTALRASRPPGTRPAACGLDLPLDRLYHRGHGYVKPEPDGTVSVGLDDLARRLVGPSEIMALPSPGTRLTRDGALLRLRAHGSEVRVLSPVEGVVVETLGAGPDVVVRVDPEGPLDTEHLLSGDEVGPWAVRELERFQGLLNPRELGVALADGGELLADLGGVVPPARVDGVLGEMFLDL
jgi:hypothetical protein